MPLTPLSIEELKRMAGVIRCDIIEMICTAEAGHPGGSLSAADIVTALYFRVMRIDPKRPDWPERDRFILSKGHACPVWYAALAERGYFDKWRAFNWHVETIDGHRMEEVVAALEAARERKGVPTAIIAETVKGKGVSFMENVADWHGKAPCNAEACQALDEIRRCTLETE